MFISSNRDYLTSDPAPAIDEAQGMRSLFSAPALILNPKECQTLQPQGRLEKIKPSPFPSGGRELSMREYENRKREAINSELDMRGEKVLQEDIQTFKAAAIFSALHLPSDFPGPEELGWGPLECSLAAGPSHLLAVTSSVWSILNKAGDSLFQCDLANWFAGFKKFDDDLMIFNPKAIYDQHSGKWILAASAWSDSAIQDGLKSYFLISVSQSSNPLGNWYGWCLDANLNGQQTTPYHAASMGIGIDNSALYLSANMFDRAGNFRYSKVRILNKSQLLQGRELQWYDFWDLRNGDQSTAFGIHPAHTFNGPGVEYLLNATQEGKEITLWSLKFPLSEKPELHRRSIPTMTYHLPPNAAQPKSLYLIDTGDARFVNAVFRNGSLWVAHTIAANWGESQNRAAIQWFQLNPGAGKITQQHVFGAPGYDYFCPTLMVDGRANMVLVFNRTGPEEYPAIRFTGRLGIDTQNKLHASSLLKQGTASGPYAWGAYNGAAVDPNDIKVWIIGKYPAAESIGATWIGETSYLRDQPEMKRKR